MSHLLVFSCYKSLLFPITMQKFQKSLQSFYDDEPYVYVTTVDDNFGSYMICLMASTACMGVVILTITLILCCYKCCSRRTGDRDNNNNYNRVINDDDAGRNYEVGQNLHEVVV